MENTNKNQRSGKLLRTCEFLSKIHPELQSYSKAIKQPERKKRVEIGKRTTTSFQRAEGQDYKSAGTLSSKERRKIQSGNKCLRTCH